MFLKPRECTVAENDNAGRCDHRTGRRGHPAAAVRRPWGACGDRAVRRGQVVRKRKLRMPNLNTDFGMMVVPRDLTRLPGVDRLEYSRFAPKWGASMGLDTDDFDSETCYMRTDVCK